jgi:CBS domain-containing protein
MRVDEIMTAPVVTVAPRTTLKDVARLLRWNEISGVPVVDGDRVVGVVSESDIVRKEATSPSPRRRPWRRARDRREAVTAGDAMTTRVVTIEPWMGIAAAAALMAEFDVNRLPVQKNGALVGIVTRADLVRAFARTDAQIEREIREEILAAFDLADVAVIVEGGRVTFVGRVDDERELEAAVSAARAVPGVVSAEPANFPHAQTSR